MLTGMEPSATNSNLAFLAEGGEMGERIRSFDWAATPLGPAETWPQSLKTAVGILLSSKFPMFLAWGEELTFLYNDPYALILGRKHPALGQPFERIWSEIWSDIAPLVERALAGEGTYWENLPLVMHRKGFEEQTWFTFSYSPLRGDDGAVCGMHCVCVETTDTVRAEQRRVAEAERLRTLFDRAPSFIAVLRGPDHVFELANASYHALIGRSDLIGKPAREALPEVEGQGFFELLDEVYRTGRPYTGHSVRLQLKRGDGPAEDRLLDFVYQPMVEADGRVGGIFVDGYDVTERETAEAKLRESEERFRLIADSAPVPMWVTRLDRRRSFVNQAYVAFLGVDPETAMTFDWRTILHPDDQERVVAESMAGEASLKPFTLEARYRRCDGEWRWIRSTSQPRWGPSGAHEGFIGVAHDVTEAKLAEAALREVNETLEKRVEARTAELRAALDRLQAEVGERERAEEALRQAQKMEAVGQLTGGIAHDFNNLLTPVVGGLEMISRQVEDPRLRRIAEAALESSRRGAKLTGQLLAFSRLQRISMAPVEVNRVIEDMQRILRHTIGAGISVETALDPAAACARCDENQLENAILNLAINARDAMPDGGRLVISTVLTEEAGAPDLAPGRYVRISVADTGQGMAPDVLARATEPFFSTKPLGKGTGLGLAQVYGIARQSEGTVRIESREGEGTTVHMLLPLSAPAAEAASAAQAAAPPRAEAAQGAHILLVDDDDDVRLFLADALRGLGHDVVACTDGAAALERLEARRPDLLLADFAMPGMNGAELARAARALAPGLPILFVTGYAESDQLEAALGGEAAAVLRKPFSIDDLAHMVAARLACARAPAQ
jgi:PAS domain S-box-containing protein